MISCFNSKTFSLSCSNPRLNASSRCSPLIQKNRAIVYKCYKTNKDKFVSIIIIVFLIIFLLWISLTLQACCWDFAMYRYAPFWDDELNLLKKRLFHWCPSFKKLFSQVSLLLSSYLQLSYIRFHLLQSVIAYSSRIPMQIHLISSKQDLESANFTHLAQDILILI